MFGRLLSCVDGDPRSGARGIWTKALGLPALAGCLVVAGLWLPVAPADAAPTTMVDLGAASTYAVFSGASVGNTVSAPGAAHTTLRGDLGVVANTQPTGFPPGIVTGAANIGNAAAASADADLVTAYTEVAARTGGAPLAGALAGATITPGLYAIAGAVSNTTTVTLDGGGDPSAVFVFQVNGAMAMAAGSHVVLVNGAQASHVFWQVNGAGAIGAGASFAGTMMALNAVAVGNGSVVNGRAFALNGALTLDDDEVYSAPPAVTITGGSVAITTDTTPTISGTTDVEAPATVTVTIGGQTL
ncbi:MAG: ice-binding family protein, partial [Gaiellales bacterium]